MCEQPTGPRSAVFNLRTFQNMTIPPPWETGQASRRLVFDMISQVDRDLANELHKNNRIKPYTASFFESKPRHNPGVVKWRVSDMAGGILQKIHSSAFRHSGQLMVDLCGVPAKFEGVSVTQDHDHRAGSLSWDELRSVRTFRRCQIKFLTPCWFKNKGIIMRMFPNPVSIFSTASLKWATYSGVDDFPHSKVFEMTSYIGERKVELSTKYVRGHDGQARYGVVGYVDYSLEMATPEWERIFSSLATFLFWSGVGKDTGAGMGQVEVIPEYEK